MTYLPSDANSDEAVRRLIVGVAEAIVDRPADVIVTLRAESTSTILTLSVASDDFGKVIGKQGRTARSIRILLDAASMKRQHHFELDIAEGTNPRALGALASQDRIASPA